MTKLVVCYFNPKTSSIYVHFVDHLPVHFDHEKRSYESAKVGYVNSYGHEIVGIYRIYKERLISLEEYEKIYYTTKQNKSNAKNKTKLRYHINKFLADYFNSKL